MALVIINNANNSSSHFKADIVREREQKIAALNTFWEVPWALLHFEHNHLFRNTYYTAGLKFLIYLLKKPGMFSDLQLSINKVYNDVRICQLAVRYRPKVTIGNKLN
jgi:hypothetical protein